MNLRIETKSGANLDGTARVFRLVECWPVQGVWLVSDVGPRKFPTVGHALLTLGGMVPWDDWTDESRAVLRALNEGHAI